MAKEKEDVVSANAGAPAANIPDLKKKEKERKRAGAAWSGVRGAGGDFVGATGGNGARAAASAVGMAAEGALVGTEGLEGGGLWAMISRILAGLTGTLLGKVTVGMAGFLLISAAGMLGYSMYNGGSVGAGGTSGPDLGGISDSMRVRAGGGDRLAVASKGEIRFDPLSAAKPAPPPVAPPAPEPPAAEPSVAANADAQKAVPSGQLAHNLSGAQLSSSLGGEFGSKNIFAGNPAAPKFGSATLKKIPGQKGQMAAMKPATIHSHAFNESMSKGSTGKAFGQLRLAKGLSQIGAAATTNEGASAAAQGAFDQQQAAGGGLNTIGAPGGDVAPPMGGTPPDTSMPGAPATPPGMGGIADPGLTNALNQISALANKAMSDIQTGTMMMMLGAILIGAGVALLPWPTTPAGVALIAAGTALIMMGMAKIAQGKAEEAAAIAMGQALAAQIQNQQQGNAVTYCTKQAVATGKPVQSCTPPDSVTNNNAQSAQDSADIQRVKQIPVDNIQLQSQ